MKHEEFLGYMKDSVTGWKNSAQFEALNHQYAGFLATVESFRDYARALDASKKTMNELLVEFSKGILRALLLVNTGGIFVVMTMVSAMLSKESHFQPMIPKIAAETIFFVVGVSLAVGAVGLSYLSQWLYTSLAKERLGFYANIAAIAAGLFSFICFVWGALALRIALTSEEIVRIITRCQSLAG